MLSRQSVQYKNYKRHGVRPEGKASLNLFRKQCEKKVLSAKDNYLKNLGSQLPDSSTRHKAYWKLIHRIMNKCKTASNHFFLSTINL